MTVTLVLRYETYPGVNIAGDAELDQIERLAAHAARNVAAHICPLQTDIVDRLIRRYSNAGELVFDPFSGLGTVTVRALKLGRRGAGVELNAGYHADAVHYARAQERAVSMPSLFDALDEAAAA